MSSDSVSAERAGTESIYQSAAKSGADFALPSEGLSVDVKSLIVDTRQMPLDNLTSHKIDVATADPYTFASANEAAYAPPVARTVSIERHQRSSPSTLDAAAVSSFLHNRIRLVAHASALPPPQPPPPPSLPSVPQPLADAHLGRDEAPPPPPPLHRVVDNVPAWPTQVEAPVARVFLHAAAVTPAPPPPPTEFDESSDTDEPPSKRIKINQSSTTKLAPELSQLPDTVQTVAPPDLMGATEALPSPDAQQPPVTSLPEEISSPCEAVPPPEVKVFEPMVPTSAQSPQLSSSPPPLPPPSLITATTQSMVSAALQIANSLQLAFSEQLATSAAHDPDSITNAADAAISSIGSAFFAAASAYGADAAIANSIDGAASASSSADADAETVSPNTSHAANSVAPAAAPVPRPRARRQRSSTDEIICEQCKRGNHPETLLLCDGCNDAHHTHCLQPPLAAVPKGAWYCAACVSAPSRQQLIRQARDAAKSEQHEWASMIAAGTAKRIGKELAEFNSFPIPNISAGPKSAANVLEWEAIIIGPECTPYHGGVFALDISFPTNYPFAPPHVVMRTRIYHCNINSNGEICLDILRDAWSPALTISKVLLSLVSLLASPNPDDPLVKAIALQLQRDRAEHDRVATQWTQRYAL